MSRNKVSRTNKKMVEAMKKTAPNLGKALPHRMKKSETFQAVVLATRYGGSQFKKATEAL